MVDHLKSMASLLHRGSGLTHRLVVALDVIAAACERVLDGQRVGTGESVSRLGLGASGDLAAETRLLDGQGGDQLALARLEIEQRAGPA